MNESSGEKSAPRCHTLMFLWLRFLCTARATITFVVKKRVEMKSDTSQMQPLFVVLLATN